MQIQREGSAGIFDRQPVSVSIQIVRLAAVSLSAADDVAVFFRDLAVQREPNARVRAGRRRLPRQQELHLVGCYLLGRLSAELYSAQANLFQCDARSVVRGQRLMHCNRRAVDQGDGDVGKSRAPRKVAQRRPRRSGWVGALKLKLGRVPARVEAVEVPAAAIPKWQAVPPLALRPLERRVDKVHLRFALR